MWVTFVSRRSIVAAVAMMLILFSIVQYTKIGKALRSVSEDKEVAALMGIDVDRVIVFTFVLGGISAGVAGVLYALIFHQVHFYMGFIPGLKAFTAAVLGGIGNVVGAWLGGTLLGLLESLGPNLFLSGLGIPADLLVGRLSHHAGNPKPTKIPIPSP